MTLKTYSRFKSKCPHTPEFYQAEDTPDVLTGITDLDPNGLSRVFMKGKRSVTKNATISQSGLLLPSWELYGRAMASSRADQENITG